VIVWDRGRPARNEREARKRIGGFCERLRAFGAFAGETPAVPAIS
jgi:hypothetical protein